LNLPRDNFFDLGEGAAGGIPAAAMQPLDRPGGTSSRNRAFWAAAMNTEMTVAVISWSDWIFSSRRTGFLKLYLIGYVPV
jgi:hypothetical protein